MSLGGLLAGFLSATSASPGDFHSIADISCPDGATGCRIELPAWVAEVQPADGDGRAWAVSTPRGDALPWRSVTDSVAPAETTWTALKMLPLERSVGAGTAEKLSFTVAERRFALDWSSSSGDSAAVSSERWIVDLREFRGSILELVPRAGDFLGSIELEGGGDLVSWSARGSFPVARIDSGAFSVRRLLIGFESGRDAFLRLTWHPVQGSLALDGLNGGLGSTASAAPAGIVDLGVEARRDSGWTWDAGGRHPAVGAFVEFRRRGAFGEMLLESRSSPDRPWSLAARSTGWHRGRDGVSIHQDTIWFSSPVRERHWRVRSVGSAASLGDSVRLVLRLRPDLIEFPTGGSARLLLAAGLEPVAFAKLEPVMGPIPEDPSRGMVGTPRLASGDPALETAPDRRTWILGGTLLFAVLALVFFAAQLWREASTTRSRD